MPPSSSLWTLSSAQLVVEAIATVAFALSGPTERAMQWPDALGLGLFSANGTQIALDASLPAIVAVLMGMVTAVFGVVLRDIVCNEIPSAFRDHRPYAVCSFAGGWVLVLALHWATPPWLALLAAAAATLLLRACALWSGLTLPAWRSAEPGDG